MKLLIKTIVLIIISSSCGDDGPKCPEEHLLPISISPSNDFYHIEDTIHISSVVYKKLYDNKTDLYYDASSYKLSPYLSIYSLNDQSKNLKGSQVNDYVKFVENSNENFKVINNLNESFVSGEYILMNDSLRFEIKLVLKEKGFYWFWFESLTSGDGHLQNNYQFNCRGRKINFILNGPEDGKIYLMQRFRSLKPNEQILSDSVNYFIKKAGYCFEVR